MFCLFVDSVFMMWVFYFRVLRSDVVYSFWGFVWFYLEKKRSKRFDCEVYLGYEVEGKETRLV